MSPGGWWRSADSGTRLMVLFGGWLVTRLLLVVLPHAEGLYPARANTYDTALFEAWGQGFAGEREPVPLRDGPWEYPAATALLMVLPALLRGASYELGFVAQMLVVDAAGLFLLLWWGRRRGSTAGAACWVVGALLLGPVMHSRFDLLPGVLAAGGLTAVSAPLLAGLLLASGGAFKLWPALLLPLVLRRETALRGAVGVALAAVAVLVPLAAWGGLPHALSFLTYQRDRGLEIESLAANALLLAHVAGVEGVSVGFDFGSFQVSGPGDHLLDLLSTACLLLVLVAVAVLAVRTRRRAGPDAHQELVHLAVLLLCGFLLTNKVLSPQYLIWLLAVVCVALCWRDSPLRRVLPALAGALVLTHWTFPLRFDGLTSLQTGPVLVLTARNLLLVVLAVQVLRVCLAAAREPGPRPVDRTAVDQPA